MPRKDPLPPDLTDEALWRAIPEGLVAYSWQMEDVPSPQAVVYSCPWCSFYHSGRSRDVPVRVDLVLDVPA
jgi:hypothetical protein